MSTATLHSEKKKALVPELRFNGFDVDWNNYSLKKIISDLNSGISVNSDDFPIQNDSEVGILKTSCVANGIFRENENKKIVENEVSRAKLNPSKNEIIISRMNTPQLVGESGYIDRDYPSLFIPDRLWQTIVNQELCISRWLSYFLITEKVRDNLKSIATGTSGTMKNISKPNFLSINVSIPTLPEQQKIASFLSAVDEKIQQLSRKKELLSQYKKGVMQQLFSGKLRFKDENGNNYADWEEKRISDYFQIKAGGDVNLENSSKIKTEKFKYPIYANSEKAKGLYGYSDLYKIDYNCITVTGRGALGIANARFEKFYPIVRLLILKPKKNIDVLFSQYALNLINIYPESTGVPQLTAPQYSSYLISFPCLEEQQKIANFLLSIDTKIESTSQQINQTQSFKKGLLQQLFV